MSFVKTLLDDGVDEWRSVEEHSLVALVVILFGNLPTTVGISVKGKYIKIEGKLVIRLVKAADSSLPLTSPLPGFSFHFLPYLRNDVTNILT